LSHVEPEMLSHVEPEMLSGVGGIHFEINQKITTGRQVQYAIPYLMFFWIYISVDTLHVNIIQYTR